MAIIREYTYGNALIAVYRPELSEKELAMIEKQILVGLHEIGKELKENQNGNGDKSRNFKK